MSYTCLSKMSVTSISSSGSSGERSHMRQFISASQEYNKHKSEEVASSLSRKLQLLGVSLDINTFDPSSSVVSEFFVSLHELMSGLDSRSPLVWFGVEVLQQACRNQAAHKALIHTYQFLPILSRLLGEHLTRDKKRKLLTLMQELTYGINVSWQISYLPQLLTTLTKWIESGDDTIMSLSLEVLLNLCYKNLPVIYTLMRTINTKQFLRTVMAMKSPSSEVQVCKLLIILEHISGQVPKDDILNFVRVTFRTIVEAFENKDLIRLRHIVQFFLELRGQTNRNEAIAEYNNYHDDVVRVLDAVENNVTNTSGDSIQVSMDLECMALLFEFLRSLVELQISELQVLYSRIVNLTLAWVQTETVCIKALALLTSIVLSPNKSDDEDVLEPIASSLSVLLHIVDSAAAVDTSVSGDQKEILSALLQLIRAVVLSKSLRSKVIATLKQASVMAVFEPLLGLTDDRKSDEPFTHTTNEEMYVHALALLSELAVHSYEWHGAFIQLLAHRQVQALLARAFYADSATMKQLVLEMVRTKDYPTQQITQTMCEIQPTVVQLNTAGIMPSASKYYRISADSCGGPPIMSGPQVEQLDQVIGRLKNALSTTSVQSVATSEVMELYEYKMAAIGHAERAAQSSLEAANQHATHLQHRLAQMSTEVSRLHQLLYHAQQLNEDTQKRMQKSDDNGQVLTTRLSKEQLRNKEFGKQLAERDKCVENQLTTIQILESKHNEAVQNNNYLSKKYEDQVNKNIALVKASAAIETNAKNLQLTLEEKNEAYVKSTLRIDELIFQVKELEELRKQHEASISHRDKELTETHKELAERMKILDTITKLTTK